MDYLNFCEVRKQMRCRCYSMSAHGDVNICVKDKPFAVNCTGIVHLDKGFVNEKTKGRNDFYLMYIIEGELDFICAETQGKLKGGQFVIISPKTYYKYRHINGGKYKPQHGKHDEVFQFPGNAFFHRESLQR